MATIKATPRTVEAIRKADRLMMSTVVGEEQTGSMNISTNVSNVSYGNSYIVKITELVGNGIYKARLLDDYGNEIRTVYIASLDMMLADVFIPNQLVQVTDSNLNYATAILEEE